MSPPLLDSSGAVRLLPPLSEKYGGEQQTAAHDAVLPFKASSSVPIYGALAEQRGADVARNETPAVQATGRKKSDRVARGAMAPPQNGVVRVRKKQQKYPEAFKAHALQLMATSSSRVAAKALGIEDHAMLRLWRRKDEMRKNGGPKSAAEKEVARLTKEVEKMKREVKVLRAAQVFFSKHKLNFPMWSASSDVDPKTQTPNSNSS